MKPVNLKRKKDRAIGMNIAEVLISLGLFSVAMVGLYMGINSMTLAMGDAMARDIEAAYANMLIAQVNLFRWDAEEAYDVNNSPRSSLSLPDGRTVYYERLVDSAALTGDVKRINVYLYRTATGGSPYRQFRREVQLPYYYLSFVTNGLTNTNWRDKAGKVWLNGSGMAYFSTSAGRYKSGWGFTDGSMVPVAPAPAVSPVVDADAWKYCAYTDTAPYRLGWAIHASSNVNYTVEIGFSEVQGAAVGARAMNVIINDVTVGTVDPRQETGGTNKPLVKTYSAGTVLQSGQAIVKVQVAQAAGATARPMACWVGITRQ